MGKSSSPKPPDYDKMAAKTMEMARFQGVASNPNVVNPFGTVASSQGPAGQWNITTTPNGTLGALTNNAIDTLGTRPDLNLSQFADAVGTGDQANQRAVQSAWDQAYRRLTPMYNEKETQTRTRLANSGLDPTAHAWHSEMGQLGELRNDAMQSAMASAITQGNQTGHTVFGDNLAAQQNAAGMYQQQWNQPMQTLGQLGALMPGDHFNPDTASLAGAKAAADIQNQGYQSALQAQAQKKDWTDTLGSVAGAAGGAAMMFSDERLKEDIVRMKAEAVPGVPWATFRYKGIPDCRRFFGVIAQDLQKVLPEYVHEDPSGYLMVDLSFLEKGGD